MSKPTPEQITEVMKRLPAWCPHDVSEWHLMETAELTRQLDRHAGLVSQYVSDEQTYGTHRELYERVSTLADVLTQAETCIFYCVKGNDGEGQRVFELIGKTLKEINPQPSELSTLRSQLAALKAELVGIIQYCDGDIMYNHMDISNIKAMAIKAIAQSREAAK